MSFLMPGARTISFCNKKQHNMAMFVVSFKCKTAISLQSQFEIQALMAFKLTNDIV